jgi:hypothetical protein
MVDPDHFVEASIEQLRNGLWLYVPAVTSTLLGLENVRTSRCFDKDMPPNNLLLAKAANAARRKRSHIFFMHTGLMIVWVTSNEAMAFKPCI